MLLPAHELCSIEITFGIKSTLREQIESWQANQTKKHNLECHLEILRFSVENQMFTQKKPIFE